MFEVSYGIKDFFFDRVKVINRLSAGERRAMSKIGAFIRVSARQSMKRRKTVAPASSPPSVHSRSKVYTLKNILFGYEPTQHRVIVGPVLLSRFAKTREAGRGNTLVKASEPIPALHEFGGTAKLLSPKGDEREVRYAARPFMGPALERERQNGKLINAWRDLL